MAARLVEQKHLIVNPALETLAALSKRLALPLRVEQVLSLLALLSETNRSQSDIKPFGSVEKCVTAP